MFWKHNFLCHFCLNGVIYCLEVGELITKGHLGWITYSFVIGSKMFTNVLLYTELSCFFSKYIGFIYNDQ